MGQERVDSRWNGDKNSVVKSGPAVQPEDSGSQTYRDLNRNRQVIQLNQLGVEGIHQGKDAVPGKLFLNN